MLPGRPGWRSPSSQAGSRSFSSASAYADRPPGRRGRARPVPRRAARPGTTGTWTSAVWASGAWTTGSPGLVCHPGTGAGFPAAPGQEGCASGRGRDGAAGWSAPCRAGWPWDGHERSGPAPARAGGAGDPPGGEVCPADREPRCGWGAGHPAAPGLVRLTFGFSTPLFDRSARIAPGAGPGNWIAAGKTPYFSGERVPACGRRGGGFRLQPRRPAASGTLTRGARWRERSDRRARPRRPGACRPGGRSGGWYRPAASRPG